MNVIQVAARKVSEGCPVSEVRAILNGQYKTLGSQKLAISKLRKLVMETHTPDLSPLRAFASEEGVAAFLALPLQVQVNLQRKHAYEPSFSPEAESCLAQLKLLPDMPSMTKGEVVQYQRQASTALRIKNENRIMLTDAPSLLQAVAAMLEDSHPNLSFPRLIVPILFVTGRRMTEVLNIMAGTSAFEPVDETGESQTYAIFRGQLKERSANRGSYKIPLLVPFRLLAQGQASLKAKATLERDNQKACERHQGNLRRALKSGLIPHLPKDADGKVCVTNHSLRSIYVAFVLHLYRCPDTDNRTTMSLLGHRELSNSLNYNGFKIEGADELRYKLGTLSL